MPKIVTQNRKAFHDYFVEEKFEAGISLAGTEVNSIRQGTINLKDSYCKTDGREIFVVGMHISPYEKGNIFNKDPLRERKLLMHKKEIMKLHSEIREKGLTLVPLRLYFVRGMVKVELGLAKGKKLYDKRDDIAKKEANRKIDRAIKEFYR